MKYYSVIYKFFGGVEIFLFGQRLITGFLVLHGWLM
jgi:hypothetical protein